MILPLYKPPLTVSSRKGRGGGNNSKKHNPRDKKKEYIYIKKKQKQASPTFYKYCTSTLAHGQIIQIFTVTYWTGKQIKRGEVDQSV